MIFETPVEAQRSCTVSDAVSERRCDYSWPMPKSDANVALGAVLIEF